MVQDVYLAGSFHQEALDERCYALLAQDGVMPKGRATAAKDEIINVMMPKALTKSALMHGIIDMKDKMLCSTRQVRQKQTCFYRVYEKCQGHCLPQSLSSIAQVIS